MLANNGNLPYYFSTSLSTFNLYHITGDADVSFFISFFSFLLLKNYSIKYILLPYYAAYTNSQWGTRTSDKLENTYTCNWVECLPHSKILDEYEKISSNI